MALPIEDWDETDSTANRFGNFYLERSHSTESSKKESKWFPMGTWVEKGESRSGVRNRPSMRSVSHYKGSLTRGEMLGTRSERGIRKEGERLKVMASAKSERVFSKRYQQWVEAAMAMEKLIEMYEVYSW